VVVIVTADASTTGAMVLRALNAIMTRVRAGDPVHGYVLDKQEHRHDADGKAM